MFSLKKLIVLSFFLFTNQLLKAQNKSVVIAFWNVENLYDTINDPAIDDE